MANFLRPPYESARSYSERKPSGLSYVHVALGQTKDVALWGGAGLWVGLNDFDSSACPAQCAEKKSAGDSYRFFTITPRRAGRTMLEARSGGRSGSAWDSVQLVVDEPIAWGAKVDPAFKAKVVEICGRLKMEPDYLMACMAFESGGTFSASKRNAMGSGAVGLIQFMKDAASDMHTTTGVLATLTAVKQLDYVERYMAMRIAKYGHLRSLEDVYMSILMPSAVGHPDTHVCFKRGTIGYQQNAGLDKDKDGVITKFEAASAVREMLVKGRRSGYYG